MDGERSGGGGGAGPEVEDEFACAEVLQGSLASLHSTVERVFTVSFGIGTDTPHSNNGQIWLKLRGPSSNVKAAKLFVRGVVNQEEQQEVSYPGVLHCVFCGARGLFMDSLIRSTSAHIVVGSPGFLLISGLAEPVVRAYSLITDLLEKYEGTQSRRPDTWDRGSGESLDSRRAFKTLVEKWEDRHTLDLLVLPGSVKEILLDLVKESKLGSNQSLTQTHGTMGARLHGDLEDRWGKPITINQTLPDSSRTTDRWADGMTVAKDPFVPAFPTPAGTPERAESAEERPGLFPQEVGEEVQLDQGAALGTKMNEGLERDDEQEIQSSMGNKEFWLLLKFFTAMGYTEDVVKRVLAQTGPKEASQILDLVQQEQDRSDQEQQSRRVPEPKTQDSVALDQRKRNRPCETEHREDDGGGAGVGSSNGETREEEKEDEAAGNTKQLQGGDSIEIKEVGQEDNFVLGVLKKAAASCGYAEQNVTKLYNMMPGGSTHQLLLELQREGSRETDPFREGPREMDDVVLEKDGIKAVQAEVEARGETELFKPALKTESKENVQAKMQNITSPNAEPDLFGWNNKPHQQPSKPKQHQPPKSQTPHQVILPEVKGPPMPTYASTLDPPLASSQTNKQHNQTPYWPGPSASKQNHQTHDSTPNPKPQPPNALKQAFQAPQTQSPSRRTP